MTLEELAKEKKLEYDLIQNSKYKLILLLDKIIYSIKQFLLKEKKVRKYYLI